LFWNSSNATSCYYPAIGTSGATSVYVSGTQAIWVTCTGPGGTGSAVTWVYVYNFLNGNGATVQSKNAAEADDAVVLEAPELALDLTRVGVETARVDFNNDGAADLLVVDSNKRTGYVLLNEHGHFRHVSKTLTNVGSLRDVKSVTIPADKAATMSVMIEQ